MRERHASQVDRRAREFEAFVAGAAGRLLHAATLLTAEAPADNPRARRLLTLALAQTYASWDYLRGEDPYDRARRHLAIRFAREAWHQYGLLGRYRLNADNADNADSAASAASADQSDNSDSPDNPGGSDGILAYLSPRARLILVLRMYEGVPEEQTAALLGLSTERVRAVCAQATAALLHPPPQQAPAVLDAKTVAS